MSTSLDCYPFFHLAVQGVPNVTLNSGCPVNGQGNVPCDPEDMRANAEMQMRALGWNGDLTLEGYTLARYMQGEVGGGTPEERVAVGEAAINRAKLEGFSDANDILLYRQPPGHPNRGFYGPIHGPSGVTTAPYGRWATTGSDPTFATAILAAMVANGETNDFSGGADDQDGIEYSAAFPNIPAYVQNLARHSKFWIGPLPGVDHWRTFLQTTIKGETDQTEWGAARVAATLDQLGPEIPSRRMSAVWDPDMPVCAKLASSSALWWLGVIGVFVGAWLFNRYPHKLGH
jgi:hypothetical protein